MIRYCTYCKKDFDFAPLAVSGREDLICPECGNVISRESRNPAGKEMADRTEEAIGNAYAKLMHLSCIFYMTVGVIGVICFFAGLSTLLYIATFISLICFIMQLLTGTLIFISGLIFLPLGAVLGYMYFGNPAGACLGIHIVFLIRHLIRDILFRLLFAFIRKISGN